MSEVFLLGLKGAAMLIGFLGGIAVAVFLGWLLLMAGVIVSDWVRK